MDAKVGGKFDIVMVDTARMIKKGLGNLTKGVKVSVSSFLPFNYKVDFKCKAIRLGFAPKSHFLTIFRCRIDFRCKATGIKRHLYEFEFDSI